MGPWEKEKKMIKRRSYPMVIEAGEGDMELIAGTGWHDEDKKAYPTLACRQSNEKHEIGLEIPILKDKDFSLDDWDFVLYFKNRESLEVWIQVMEALRGAFGEEATDEES